MNDYPTTQRPTDETTLTKIPAVKVSGFRVIQYDEVVSNHRIARLAILASQNGNGTAYAIIDGQLARIVEHQGALRGKQSVDSTRYLDAEGNEWVKCADNHFEPAETVCNGMLSAYYKCAVLA
jgi:hypothetical protein